MEQYELMEAKYISKEQSRKKFSVSMQHYTFAVNAFVELVKQFGMDEYEFAVHETKTHQVIEDVAEEVLSTYEYKRLIKADDRATMLNLMVGLNGYTLCSGIICEDLNGSDYCAVKLDSDEIMTIGYVARKGVNISALGKKYLEEISRYKDKALK